MSEFENFNDPNIYLDTSISQIDTVSIIFSFNKLLETFHLLFNKNIMTKKNHYMEFIYKQGMKCLNHIFVLLLQYTNNIQFTYYHCEKGIYYFTEFISQIENENSFLKLSSIDAIIFVYKKTIYNVNKKMANTTSFPSLKEANNIIKLILDMNSIKNYESLSPHYEKFARLSENKINEVFMHVGDLNDSKEILEELKHLL
jgi:hypothetical protein